MVLGDKHQTRQPSNAIVDEVKRNVVLTLNTNGGCKDNKTGFNGLYHHVSVGVEGVVKLFTGMVLKSVETCVFSYFPDSQFRNM